MQLYFNVGIPCIRINIYKYILYSSYIYVCMYACMCKLFINEATNPQRNSPPSYQMVTIFIIALKLFTYDTIVTTKNGTEV